MRLVILSIALALAGSAPLAAEVQAPITAQPLAPGEVLLEVNAFGLVSSRADRATMSFGVSASGGTEAEARSATATSIREMRAALRGLGIAEADIRVGPISTSMSTMTADMAMDAAANATMEAAENVADSAMPETMSSATGNAQFDIVVRNVDSVPAVQQAIMDRGVFVVMPVYLLTDDAGPRRQARAQALEKARADAEAYAASLNMRIVRVVRVTERLGLDLLGLFASEMQRASQMFTPAMLRMGPDVPTMVVVGVDYALVPR